MVNIPVAPAQSNRFVLALIILVLIKGVFFVALLPAWEGDDETAYWADIRAAVGEPGIWRGAGATMHGRTYPTLVSPIYRLTSAYSVTHRLFLIRMVSALFLSIGVGLTYLSAKAIWPHSTFAQTIAPLFTAFNPKLSFVMASVSGDVFLFLLLSAFFYALIRLIVKPDYPHAALLTGLLAIGIVTKDRFLVAFPVLFAGLTLLVLIYLLSSNVFKNHKYKFVIAGLGLALAAQRLWPVVTQMVVSRLHQLSGRVALATATLDPKVTALLMESSYPRRLFRQFWGFYTWSHGIYLSYSINRILLVLVAAGVVGLFVRGCRGVLSLFSPNAAGTDNPTRDFSLVFRPPTIEQYRHTLALFINFAAIAVVLFTVAAYELYVSGLGRYLLGGSLPFAVAMAGGLDGLIPRRIQGPALTALAVGLLTLNIVSLTAYVMPRFY